MSNSSLVDYVKISPNKNSPRNHKIDTITIHHMAGNLSVEKCGEVFAPSSRQASSNYGVGTDGRIGMYVEEKDRSWCSSNPANDNRAITIEVANDGGAPNWHVSDKALAATIDLCVDICKRNGIKRLNYTGNKSGNLTEHNYFAATACPGPYLKSKLPYIADMVNKRLNGSASNTNPPKPSGTKSVEEVAKEVISGKWGNGQDRINRLKAAGYDPTAVQNKVNELLGKTTTSKKSVDEIAKEVIKGLWGNGQNRINRLKAAGYDPNAVQKRVNELL